MPRDPRRLSHQGEVTIYQDDMKIMVAAWLYAEGEAPASSFTGRYVSNDGAPELHEGAALIRFGGGDEADAFITRAGAKSGRFKISEPLRSLRFAKPS